MCYPEQDMRDEIAAKFPDHDQLDALEHRIIDDNNELLEPMREFQLFLADVITTLDKMRPSRNQPNSEVMVDIFEYREQIEERMPEPRLRYLYIEALLNEKLLELFIAEQINEFDAIAAEVAQRIIEAEAVVEDFDAVTEQLEKFHDFANFVVNNYYRRLREAIERTTYLYFNKKKAIFNMFLKYLLEG